jgi:hypothetical protein
MLLIDGGSSLNDSSRREPCLLSGKRGGTHGPEEIARGVSPMQQDRLPL